METTEHIRTLQMLTNNILGTFLNNWTAGFCFVLFLDLFIFLCINVLFCLCTVSVPVVC